MRARKRQGCTVHLGARAAVHSAETKLTDLPCMTGLLCYIVVQHTMHQAAARRFERQLEESRVLIWSAQQTTEARHGTASPLQYTSSDRLAKAPRGDTNSGNLPS